MVEKPLATEEDREGGSKSGGDENIEIAIPDEEEEAGDAEVKLLSPAVVKTGSEPPTTDS